MQTYKDIEYIIVDGDSSDGTKQILFQYSKEVTKIISEKDHGLYFAINKGIQNSSGEIIGVLHADDFYTDEFVIEKVVATFKNNNTDSVYGNIKFIKDYKRSQIVRYVSGKYFHHKQIRFGFMPPHPSLFIKKEIFNKYGLYNVDYEIASDYEIIVRFFATYKITYKYIDIDMVIMRIGGKSTKSFLSNIIICKESLKACKENGLYSNIIFILLKFPIKIFQFVTFNK